MKIKIKQNSKSTQLIFWISLIIVGSIVEWIVATALYNGDTTVHLVLAGLSLPLYAYGLSLGIKQIQKIFKK